MPNILFIGNSFTFVNDLPKMLETLAADTGVTITTSSVLKGGAIRNMIAAAVSRKPIPHKNGISSFCRIRASIRQEIPRIFLYPPKNYVKP